VEIEPGELGDGLQRRSLRVGGIDIRDQEDVAAKNLAGNRDALDVASDASSDLYFRAEKSRTGDALEHVFERVVRIVREIAGGGIDRDLGSPASPDQVADPHSEGLPDGIQERDVDSAEQADDFVLDPRMVAAVEDCRPDDIEIEQRLAEELGADERKLLAKDRWRAARLAEAENAVRRLDLDDRASRREIAHRLGVAVDGGLRRAVLISLQLNCPDERDRGLPHGGGHQREAGRVFGSARLNRSLHRQYLIVAWRAISRPRAAMPRCSPGCRATLLPPLRSVA
jgi:hypothetical protein